MTKIQETIDLLQFASGYLAETLAEMAARRWAPDPEGVLAAAVMARQAEDAAVLAKAREVLLRRAAELTD